MRVRTHLAGVIHLVYGGCMTTLKQCDNCSKTTPETNRDEIEFEWFKIADFSGLLQYEVCSVDCGHRIFAGAIKDKMDEVTVALDDGEVATV